MNSKFVDNFLSESIEILKLVDSNDLDNMAILLSKVKSRKGRIFFVGSGGGAGHSSHATCDFRKLAGIECYSVSDNVSELTARVNDESWADAYANWLKVSNFNKNDCLFVISVGGGDPVKKISENLVKSMDLARKVGASITGIVGRDGGYLSKVADSCVVIPTVNPVNVTTQVEGFQSLFWHLLVCHPILESATPKWESIS